ncbi:MAG: hypothetical protein HW393_244 [Dehalococcoidia bacterium]|nr:hypothetical protein [Dehalococcoidia bacterium]
MERKQAGKVERKTVDVYVRLGTSAWSQSDEDARPPAAIVRPAWAAVNETLPPPHPHHVQPASAKEQQAGRRRTRPTVPDAGPA